MKISKQRSVCVIAAVLAGLVATSAMSRPAGPVLSLYEARTANVVMQEFELSCGAAALATILRYQHGENIGEREVALGLVARDAYLAQPELIRARGGFSLLDLKRYTESLGYHGAAYGGMELADLAESTPIIVPISVHGYNHFVVVRGVSRDSVLLADPAYGNRTMPLEHFRQSWIRFAEFGQVGFVVERLDGLTPPNRLAPGGTDFRPYGED